MYNLYKTLRIADWVMRAITSKADRATQRKTELLRNELIHADTGNSCRMNAKPRRMLAATSTQLRRYQYLIHAPTTRPSPWLARRANMAMSSVPARAVVNAARIPWAL